MNSEPGKKKKNQERSEIGTEKEKIPYPYTFDPEKRRISRVYLRARVLSGFFNGVILPLVLYAFLFLSGQHTALATFLSALLPEAAIIPFYALAVIALTFIVQFPLSFYFGFVYEHQYKLSRHTLKSWFVDYFKGVLLAFAFSVPVLWGLYALLGFSTLWWVWGGVAYLALSLFLNFIYPVLIFPFFYKTKPYTDEMQKKRLLDMVHKAGVKNVNDVKVGLESEKSVKPNAFFAGVGKTQQIVLFDTLLDNFTPDEVETVVAHELGHYVHKDIWRGLVVDTLKVVFILMAIDLILPAILPLVGLAGAADIASLPLFLFLFGVLDFVLSPIELWYTRRMETQADWFALEIAQKSEAQASTERRLADLALVDHRPHVLFEWMFFTHPATWRRIKMAEEWKPQQTEAQ